MTTTYIKVPAHTNLNLGEDIFIPDHIGVRSPEYPSTGINVQLPQEKLSKFSKKNEFVLENKPMAGFKVAVNMAYDVTKPTEPDLAAVIYVQDPRGFRVGLNPSNFAALLMNNSIHNLEILQPCVYAGVRGKGLVMLLPAGNSTQSEVAAENKERLSKKTVMSEIPVGSKIKLDTGEYFYYYGIHNILTNGGKSAARKHMLWNIEEKRWESLSAGRYITQVDSSVISDIVLEDEFEVYYRTYGLKSLDKADTEKMYEVAADLVPLPKGSYIPYRTPLYFIVDGVLYTTKKIDNRTMADPKVCSGPLAEKLVTGDIVCSYSRALLPQAMSNFNDLLVVNDTPVHAINPSAHQLYELDIVVSVVTEKETSKGYCIL